MASRLVPKDGDDQSGLDADKVSMLTTLFHSQLPKLDKSEFLVSFRSLDPKAEPVMVTQNEYMRRMKDMAATQPGMAFYAELPDSYNLIVNTSHPVVERVLNEAEGKIGEELKPLRETVETDNAKLTGVRAAIKDNKPTDEQKAEETALLESVEKARKEQEKIVSEYAAKQPVVRQMIDLALLGNGLLQGKALTDFVRRSVEML